MGELSEHAIGSLRMWRRSKTKCVYFRGEAPSQRGQGANCVRREQWQHAFSIAKKPTQKPQFNPTGVRGNMVLGARANPMRALGWARR